MAPRTGICHICGIDGPLTFEHVPPKAAFNSQPVTFLSMEDSLKVIPGGSIPRGRTQQRGVGGYTLCARCNNFTGAAYVNQFVAFVRQAKELMIRSQGRPTLAYPYHIFPLPVIKQIVAMFMSINSSTFQREHQELVRFVLNPESRYLSSMYRFYVHYVADVNGGIRSHGKLVSYSAKDRSIKVYSELTFPPLGYIMTLDSAPPSNKLLDITHFTRYSLDAFRMMQLQMPVLPTHLAIPGDYRSKDEILEHLARNNEGTDDAEAA